MCLPTGANKSNIPKYLIDSYRVDTTQSEQMQAQNEENTGCKPLVEYAGVHQLSITPGCI